MATGYKIKGADIDTIFESFTPVEQSTYGVTASKFSDFDNSHKNRNSDLGSTTIIPTSAGSYLGGTNSTDKYKFKNTPIDVALKGRRPIGIPVAEIKGNANSRAGFNKYINNRGSAGTWLSDSPNVAAGIRLAHDPQCMFIEIQTGGGGGGCSGRTHAAAGGASGTYGIFKIDLPVNQYIKFFVGGCGEPGGDGSVGRNEEKGGEGGDVHILLNETPICYLWGGGGGQGKGLDPDGGVAKGYEMHMNQYTLPNSLFNGAPGARKEDKGGGRPNVNCILDKPEQSKFFKPGTDGGTSENNGGGGGGGSIYGNGGFSRHKQNGQDGQGFGAGAGGGGFGSWREVHRGGKGGTSIIKIYY